jgi:IclR family transcriptional regulator, acetate operon repressor
MKDSGTTVTPKNGEPKAPGGTRIQSVARGCQLLLWLAERRHGATAKEAAFATRLALPTTYHLLNTLVDQGLLTKDGQRRYTLGRSTAILAQAYLRGSSVPESLLSALREVAAQTNETVYLADWGEHDIRVLASVEGKNIVRVAEVAGGAYEAAHARANGKVLLAYAWPEVREAYLDAHPLRPRTARTICEPGDLETELESIRDRGYAIDNEEFAEGVSCVAAPIIENGGIVAALGLSVPTERFAKTKDELTHTLLKVIAEIDTYEDGDSAGEPAIRLAAN